MDSNVLLWGFGVVLALFTLFIWVRLVRFALSGRWTPEFRPAASHQHAQTLKEDPAS
ncbi:hypothetical protein LRS10_13340 [Phenylobacterium sp. J426]|uniref:hypothetical protein n=1 Tax=Phenylobacterium sp. J426 TaxID=2898439 RepID=UPI002151BAE7|nr:hypothetical protein [Phenylobacterium sp. J426]MCR5875079.1 hypothetical protein [Phenylobacterium sp. J426]